MGDTPTSLPIGLQVSLPGHFDVPVVLESARPLAKGFECRVRLPDGTLDEAVLSAEEAAALAGSSPDADAKVPLANAEYTLEPADTVHLEGKDAAQMLRLLERLEDDDDVQNVHANFEASEEALEEAARGA